MLLAAFASLTTIFGGHFVNRRLDRAALYEISKPRLRIGPGLSVSEGSTRFMPTACYSGSLAAAFNALRRNHRSKASSNHAATKG